MLVKLYFNKNSALTCWLLKITHTNPGNVPPNFFSKVATDSGFLGPKIFLRYFSKLENSSLKRKRKTEGDFLPYQLNYTLFKTLSQILSLSQFLDGMNFKTKNYKLLPLKFGIVLDVVIFHYWILFTIVKYCFQEKKDQK